MSKEPKGIVKDIMDAKDKVEKEWYKCPECGAEGHNTHYPFCSKAKTVGDKKRKPHLYLHGAAEINKSNEVTKFQISHVSVDEDFFELFKHIGFIKPEEVLFVSVDKYNKLKKKYRTIILIMVILLSVACLAEYLWLALRGGV